jgi:type IV secretory pathway VirB10-like protein
MKKPTKRKPRLLSRRDTLPHNDREQRPPDGDDVLRQILDKWSLRILLIVVFILFVVQILSWAIPEIAIGCEKIWKCKKNRPAEPNPPTLQVLPDEASNKKLPRATPERLVIDAPVEAPPDKPQAPPVPTKAAKISPTRKPAPKNPERATRAATKSIRRVVAGARAAAARMNPAVDLHWQRPTREVTRRKSAAPASLDPGLNGKKWAGPAE